MSPARKRKPVPVPQGAVTELLGDPVPLRDALAKHRIRCEGCKGFFPASRIHFERCDVCDRYKAYCKKCGGLERSVIGILYHCMWYASKRGVKFDGGLHTSTWARYKRTKKRESLLKPRFKVLKGGKSA